MLSITLLQKQRKECKFLTYQDYLIIMYSSKTHSALIPQTDPRNQDENLINQTAEEMDK
jgi:hypothetical protein